MHIEIYNKNIPGFKKIYVVKSELGLLFIVGGIIYREKIGIRGMRRRGASQMRRSTGLYYYTNISCIFGIFTLHTISRLEVRWGGCHH